MKIECPKCDYYYSDDLATSFVPGEGSISQLFGSEVEKRMLNRLPFVLLDDCEHFICPVCNHVFTRD